MTTDTTPYDHSMPGLTRVDILRQDPSSAPTESPASEARYPSRHGSWMLRFSDQSELRMGSPFWRKTQLIHEDKDVTAEQGLGKSLGSGAFPLDCYVPWSARSDKVLIPTVHPAGSAFTLGFVVHDVMRGRVLFEDNDFWLRAGVWAPHDDLVLLVSDTVCRVVTGRGSTTAIVDNSLGWDLPVAAGWTPTGRWFFCTGPGERSPTDLRFFDSTSGTEVERVALDADALVPYAADDYASLDRDRYCLQIGLGHRGAARLLDDWAEAKFDSETSTLLLAVFRPTSPLQRLPSVRGSSDVVIGCSAKRQWISAQVVE